MTRITRQFIAPRRTDAAGRCRGVHGPVLGGPMKISGANAIVVGGASGMARATAEMLVREGARVAILDRPTSQGEQVAAAIGGGTRFHPCDVVDFAATEAAIRRAADDLG